MKTCAWLLPITLIGCSTAPVDPLDSSAYTRFSAKLTLDVGDRHDVYEYYRDGTKARFVPTEGGFVSQEGPGRVAIIVDSDAKTATAISYDRQQYSAIPFLAASAGLEGQVGVQGEPQADKQLEVVSREDLGEEIAAAHDCRVQRVVTKIHGGEKQSMDVWNADDLRGFPVKMRTVRAGRNVTTTFTDVKLDAPVDPNLFTIPAGFSNANPGRRSAR
jgi:hypothetical protein